MATIGTHISPEAHINQITLEKMRVMAAEKVSGQLLHSMRLESWPDHISDAMVYRLTSYVLAEETDRQEETVTFSYPADWWQMWKSQHAPKWLVKRWPVQEKTVEKKITIRKMATYPKLADVVPDDQGRVVFKTLVDKY